MQHNHVLRPVSAICSGTALALQGWRGVLEQWKSARPRSECSQGCAWPLAPVAPTSPPGAVMHPLPWPHPKPRRSAPIRPRGSASNSQRRSSATARQRRSARPGLCRRPPRRPSNGARRAARPRAQATRQPVVEEAPPPAVAEEARVAIPPPSNRSAIGGARAGAAAGTAGAAVRGTGRLGRLGDRPAGRNGARRASGRASKTRSWPTSRATCASATGWRFRPGAKAHGEVTLVERGGRLRDRARLGVRFTSIVLADGTRVPLETDTIYREGDAPGGESAAKIGGGAIGGAIIGGILGGAKGAIIGGIGRRRRRHRRRAGRRPQRRDAPGRNTGHRPRAEAGDRDRRKVGDRVRVSCPAFGPAFAGPFVCTSALGVRWAAQGAMHDCSIDARGGPGRSAHASRSLAQVRRRRSPASGTIPGSTPRSAAAGQVDPAAMTGAEERRLRLGDQPAARRTRRAPTSTPAAPPRRPPA